jgi:hypothetical protein
MQWTMSSRAAWLFVAAIHVTPVTGEREDLNFDFNWRFRLGLHMPPPPPPPPSPPAGCAGAYAFHNKSGVACRGLGHDSKGDASAEDCEKRCCEDDGCAVWQWAPESVQPPASAGGCWRGVCPTFYPRTEFIGAVRTPPRTLPPTPSPLPPGTIPAEAQRNFSDSNWTLVQTPHDSLIDSAPSHELCPSGCSGRSYIPRYVSWYRKSFSAPQEWEGSAVWLYFDGIFRETTIYLNGQNITSHTAGYTSFAVRLDGNGLEYGASSKNVLAVFVDSDTGRSGWWYEGGGIYR